MDQEIILKSKISLLVDIKDRLEAHEKLISDLSLLINNLQEEQNKNRFFLKKLLKDFEKIKHQ